MLQDKTARRVRRFGRDGHRCRREDHWRLTWPVRIGDRVHILANAVLHLLPNNERIIEDDVVIGPGA